jgi:hypothetical protein
MFSSARYILFLAPPLILLSLLGCGTLPPKKILAGALSLNGCFVIVLAVADYKIAEAYRWALQAVVAPAQRDSPGRFLFSGHWGFQYYAEKAGGRHISRADIRPPQFRRGDLLLVAETAWSPLLEPPAQPGRPVEAHHIYYDPHWPLRTIDCGAAANFYTCLNSGCPRPAFLPYGFAGGESERFHLYLFK